MTDRRSVSSALAELRLRLSCGETMYLVYPPSHSELSTPANVLCAKLVPVGAGRFDRFWLHVAEGDWVQHSRKTDCGLSIDDFLVAQDTRIFSFETQALATLQILLRKTPRDREVQVHRIFSDR